MDGVLVRSKIDCNVESINSGSPNELSNPFVAQRAARCYGQLVSKSSGWRGERKFTWATISENDNAGFNLLAEWSTALISVNEELILSKVINSVLPQLYEYVALVSETAF